MFMLSGEESPFGLQDICGLWVFQTLFPLKSNICFKFDKLIITNY